MIKRDKTTYTVFDWEFIDFWAQASSLDYLENVYKFRSEIGYEMVKNHMKQLAFFDFFTEPKNTKE
jgi:hypothetical protein